MNNLKNEYQHLRNDVIKQIKEKGEKDPEKYFDKMDCLMEELYSYMSELESQNNNLRITKELNKKLTVAVEQSPVTIVITDINGTIEYVNPCFYKTTGYSKDEAIGKNPSILKTGMTNPRLHQELWNTITQGKTWQGQFVNKTKYGEEYVENSIVASIFNDNNDITHFIAIKEDVTEKVKIENEIKKNQQLHEKELEKLISTKDRFISILGHDLKNPFNSILGFSDLLLSDFNNLERERIFKYVKLINQSSQETYNLLNNLLEWSKSQQKQVPFNPQYEYLDNIILEIHQSLNNSAISKHIKIKIDTDEIIEMEIDKEMIKTVLRNMVSNAIKFTPEKGIINISAHKLSDSAIIKIMDTGIGMDKELVQSLFHINKTRSIRGTNGEKGTGFGLLLCKELVEEHKGKIDVQSEVGKGSSFIITLPLRQNNK